MLARKKIFAIALITCMLSNAFVYLFTVDPDRSADVPLSRITSDGLSRYALHDPIIITSDAGFNSTNGVVSGLGTSASPYVIEGWEFAPSTSDDCISIQSTTAYFTIRNCKFSSKNWGDGVHVNSASHGLVLNNLFTEGYVGVYVQASNNMTIKGNVFEGNLYGEAVWLYGSEGVVVCDNSVKLNYGMADYYGNNNVFENNTLECVYLGMRLLSATYAKLYSNALVNCSIQLEGSTLSSWNTHEIPINNTVNGLYVQYIKSTSNVTAPTDMGELIIANCNNITATGISMTGNYKFAIIVGYSNNTKFTNNALNIQGMGIYCYGANNTLVENNNITFSNSISDTQGLVLAYSDNARVLSNNISNMSHAVECSHSNNVIFSSNAFFNNGYGIYLITGCSHVNISNNAFSRNFGCSVYASNLNNLTVTGNVYNDSNSGLVFSSVMYSNVTNETFSNMNSNAFMCNSGNTIGISECAFYSCNIGLLIKNMRNVLVEGCSFVGGTGRTEAIRLDSDRGITLANNTMQGCGVVLAGANAYYWTEHSIDTTNTVNGKPVRYIVNSTGTAVPTDAGQLILGNCSQLDISSMNMPNCSYALQVGLSSNCTITNVSGEGNKGAIRLVKCMNFTISSCNISNCSNGIVISDSSVENTILDSIFNNCQNGVSLWDYSSVSRGAEDAGTRNAPRAGLTTINNTVRNSTFNSIEGTAVDASGTMGTTVANCTIAQYYGITFSGSAYCRVNDNDITTNSSCISMYNALSISLARNALSSVNRNGVYISNSQCCVMTHNTMTHCGVSIHDNGLGEPGYLPFWNTHSIDSTNLANGLPVVYVVNQTSPAIPPAGQAIIANCTNVTITGQSIFEMPIGLEVAFSDNVTISSNSILNCTTCIDLYATPNSSVVNNTIGEPEDAGVSAHICPNVGIIGNVIEGINGPSDSMWASGIDLQQSPNASISSNTISHTYDGIYAWQCEYALFENNTLEDNDFGTEIYELKYSTLRSNTLNRCGVFISSTLEDMLSNAMDISNVVNGRKLYFVKNATSYSVPPDAGQIIIVNSTNVMAKGLNLSYASMGVTIIYSSNVSLGALDVSNEYIGIESSYSENITVENCTARGDYYMGLDFSFSKNVTIIGCMIDGSESGLELYGMENVLITRNRVMNCKGFGILVFYGCRNTFVHHNDIINCSSEEGGPQALDYFNLAVWNDSEGGNFWSDWQTPDSNSDGIIDLPYAIFTESGYPQTYDYLPLRYSLTTENQPPSVHIVSITPSPAQHNQTINFVGSATDADGTIASCMWWTNVTGMLSTEEEFNATLPVGVYNVSFSAVDNNGSASTTYCTLVVTQAIPNAFIDSITPNPAQSGANVTFTGHGADFDGTVITCEWSSNRSGVLSNAFTFTTSSLPAGVHLISFRVCDNNGSWSAPVTQQLAILSVTPGENTPPVASIDSITPSPAFAGQEITFTGSGVDLDGTIIAYNWTSNITGALSTQHAFSTTLPVGTHLISLTVCDNNNSWSEAATAILVVRDPAGQNVPPTVGTVTITPNPAIEGQAITFTGTGIDADGTITEYNWTSDISGKLSTQSSFTNSSLPAGAHSISFSVKDNNGSWSAPTTIILQINPYVPGTNIPPTALISNVTPNPALVGAMVSFTGSGTDADGTITEYRWESNISGFLSNSASFSVSTLPVGVHSISFRVKDNNDTWSQNATITVRINALPNDAPVATITSILPNPANYGDAITFTGSATDADGTVVAYEWSSNISGILNGNATFSLSTLPLGTHAITLRVQDDDGAWSAGVTVTIVVKEKPNSAPVISSIKPKDGSKYTVGTTIKFEASATDADNDVITYRWLDGSTLLSTERAFSAKLSKGAHTITLEVSDNKTTATRSVKVIVEDASNSTPILLFAIVGIVIAVVVVLAIVLMMRKKPVPVQMVVATAEPPATQPMPEAPSRVPPGDQAEQPKQG